MNEDVIDELSERGTPATQSLRMLKKFRELMPDSAKVCVLCDALYKAGLQSVADKHFNPDLYIDRILRPPPIPTLSQGTFPLFVDVRLRNSNSIQDGLEVAVAALQVESGIACPNSEARVYTEGTHKSASVGTADEASLQQGRSHYSHVLHTGIH